MAIALFVASVVACGYRPNSLQPREDSQAIVRELGCLDVLIEREYDPVATGPAVRITFGNRCDAPVRVDLGAIEAEVHYRDGTRGRMQAFDPDRVIRPGVLDGRSRGWEVLEYHPLTSDESGKVAEALCMELQAIVGEPAMSHAPVIACLSLEATIVGRGG